jgi:hypothetical protein
MLHAVIALALQLLGQQCHQHSGLTCVVFFLNDTGLGAGIAT